MNVALSISGSSHPEVFLGKGVLKIYNKFTGGHQCRSAHRHGCSPVNLLYIFRTLFPRNTSGWLLLYLRVLSRDKHNSIFRFRFKNFEFCVQQPFIPLISQLFQLSFCSVQTTFSKEPSGHSFLFSNNAIHWNSGHALKRFCAKFFLKIIHRELLLSAISKFFIEVPLKSFSKMRNTIFDYLLRIHKIWSFPLEISSVNVTKSAVCCGFGHIYRNNP